MGTAPSCCFRALGVSVRPSRGANLANMTMDSNVVRKANMIRRMLLGMSNFVLVSGCVGGGLSFSFLKYSEKFSFLIQHG